MAVRKTSTRKTAKKPPLKSAKSARNRMPVSVAFRIFVLIVIIIAFFMLLPIIKNLRNNTKATETEQQEQETDSNSKEQSKERDKREEENKPQAEKPVAPEQKEPEKKPQAEKPAVTEQPEKKPQTEKPAATEQKPQEQKPSTPAPVSTPPVKPAETRGSIYLISNGILVKVNRNLNTNTPLTDSINALLAGPTPDEIMRGIESFVPEGSRLLKTPAIKGGTVELDFNQEFRYNTRGSEGCAAQIKQIVWTATEFPNVQNVQFLIEGKRVDFLSEGVVLSSPIGR
jgi:spore germination protein GerM